jgi:dihydroorotase
VVNPRDLVVRNVRLIDPYRGVDGRADVAVHKGRYAKEPGPGAEVLEGRGLWLVPRLADLHVHFRDPGETHKEDLHSGMRAAVAGGFSAVGVMPNTVPVMDRPDLVEAMRQRSAAIDLVDVWPIAAVTVRSAGSLPADWDALSRAGAMAFSDDGRSVWRSGVMAGALTFSQSAGRPIIQHLEDPELAAGGVAHAGDAALTLNLRGMPAAAESVMAWRDAALLRAVGGHLHLAHCSVPETLEAVAWAQSRGLKMTAEAAPHHLLLTDEALVEWGGSAITKVNPPLRPAAMRDALRRAVIKGVVSVIASDHAPHHAEEKVRPYPEAPFGISGIETMLGVAMTVFLGEGLMRPLDLMARFTRGPHEVVGSQPGGVAPGLPADFVLIDPDVEWTVDPREFFSRGHNTPLAGRRLYGRPVATVRGGRFVFREGTVWDG